MNKIKLKDALASKRPQSSRNRCCQSLCSTKTECTLVLSVNNGVHTHAERASDIAQKEASAWL